MNVTSTEKTDPKRWGIWNPIESGLPKDEEMKLVTCETKKGVKSVNRAYYSNGSWHGSGSMSGVIVWADMPKPYENVPDVTHRASIHIEIEDGVIVRERVTGGTCPIMWAGLDLAVRVGNRAGFEQEHLIEVLEAVVKEEKEAVTARTPLQDPYEEKAR